jgi:hypothetical protein
VRCFGTCPGLRAAPIGRDGGQGNELNRTWLLLVLVIVQIGIGIVLVAGFPGARRDFLIQMTAGRVAELDGFGQVYDRELQLRRQLEVRHQAEDEKVLLPFNHPPLLLPFLRPLSRLEYGRAYLIWTVCTVLLLILAVFVLTSAFSDNGASGLQLTAVRMAVLTFFPIAVVVAQGQDTSVLLIGVAAWIVLFSSRRDFAAGVLLSLASIRPHLAIGLALPFLFARRNVFTGFLIGVTILASFSISLVGFQGAVDYVELIRESSIGDTLVIAEGRMPNFLGLIRRLGGADSRAVAAIAAWLTWIAFIVATSIWWRSMGSRVSSVHCGLLVVGTVVLVPHIHLHDLAVLTVPAIAAAAGYLAASRADWELPIIALGVASLFLTVMAVTDSPVFDICLAAAIFLITAPLMREPRAMSGTPRTSGNPLE